MDNEYSLCNSNQFRKAQVITRDDDGDIAFDDASRLIVVADGSRQDAIVGVQPVQVLGGVRLGSEQSRLGDSLRVDRLWVGSGGELYVALDALVGVLGDVGHLMCAKGHCHRSMVEVDTMDTRGGVMLIVRDK